MDLMNNQRQRYFQMNNFPIIFIHIKIIVIQEKHIKRSSNLCCSTNSKYIYLFLFFLQKKYDDWKDKVAMVGNIFHLLIKYDYIMLKSNTTLTNFCLIIINRIKRERKCNIIPFVFLVTRVKKEQRGKRNQKQF